MRGDFRQTSLADVLRHLYVVRENGVLHVSDADASKRIHFSNGVPIYCAAASPSLSRDESRDLLYPLFAQRSGEFAFEKMDLPIDDELALEESLPETILAGSRTIEDVETLEELVGGHDSVFACSATAVLPLFSVKLTETERTLLEFGRERDRFELADAELAVDKLEALRALNALLSLGLLELMEKKASVPKTVVTVEVKAERKETLEVTSEAADIAKAMAQAKSQSQSQASTADVSTTISASPPPEPDPADVEALLDAYEATVAASSAKKPAKVSKRSRIVAPVFLVTDKLPTSRRGRATLTLALLGTLLVAGAVWLMTAPGAENILQNLRSSFTSTQAPSR